MEGKLTTRTALMQGSFTMEGDFVENLYGMERLNKSRETF